jgi:hypothetical protein
VNVLTNSPKINIEGKNQRIFLTNTFFVLLVKALIAKRNVIAGQITPKIHTQTSL